MIGIGLSSLAAVQGPAAKAQSLDGWQPTVDLAELQLDGRNTIHWESALYHPVGLGRLHLEFDADSERFTRIKGVQTQMLYEAQISRSAAFWAGGEHDAGQGISSSIVVGGNVQPFPWLYGETSLFLATNGKAFQQVKLVARTGLHGELDLEPRLVLNSAFQADPSRHLGAGLNDLSMEIRVRLKRKVGFAPYAGIKWNSALGETARWARASGDKTRSCAVLLGFGFGF